MHKKTPRHLARSLAVQAIYAYKLNQEEISQIEDFLRINSNIFSRANHELMLFLVTTTIKNFDNNLKEYLPFLTREIKEINLIEQIILALATTELIYSLNVPASVIINEAIELTKLYGAEDSYKFINGLIDKLANKLRPLEKR